MHTRLDYAWRSCVTLAVLLALPAVADAQVQIESATFGGLRARAIGPSTMSGRIAAMDVVPEYPLTIYIGAASGGVWKSRDGGLRFEPVFDDHTMSIGAIRIDPSNQDVVWVGTGETWVRNSVSVGNGVFKTTDGGDTWQFMGLEDSERIARIAVDPMNGDRVYVCATGHLWDANQERGVFRTTDGGETWEKVLYINEDTGCSDLSMDPHAPNIVRHRLLRSLHGPPRAEHTVRRYVGVPALAVLLQLRRPQQRALPLDRRRRHLAGADGRAA
jgi:photosystem II stability/assembly factor-like uncharacterized protein